MLRYQGLQLRLEAQGSELRAWQLMFCLSLGEWGVA